MNITLPNNVTTFRRSSVYTQDNIPKVLFDSHHTKNNVWAVIHVQKGELAYHVDQDSRTQTLVKPDTPCVIEPEVDHHIEAIQDVEFFIEYCH